MEIYTHFLAGMVYRYHNLWKDMGTLRLYHSWPDVYEDGIGIQHTGCTHIYSAQQISPTIFAENLTCADNVINFNFLERYPVGRAIYL